MALWNAWAHKTFTQVRRKASGKGLAQSQSKALYPKGELQNITQALSQSQQAKVDRAYMGSRKPRHVVVKSVEDLENLLKSGTKISRIAAMPSKKKMEQLKNSLPNVHLEDDEMLALVDSGSTLNAADIAKHFPAFADRIVSSKAQLQGETATTAGGHQLRN